MTIRQCRETDPIHTLLSPKAVSTLDRSQIIVVAEGSTLYGLVVVFDCPHKVLFVDSLVLAPNASPKIAIYLLQGVMAYCQLRGKTDFYFASSSNSLKSLAIHHGGHTVPVSYLGYVPVEE